MAMSDLELRIYRAELALGWQEEQIRLQVAIRGGRNFRGGLVVDQVIYRPFALPVFLNGDFWHRDGGQEHWERAAVFEEFKVEPVVIWGHEAQDDDQAQAVVLARIGRP